MHLLQVRLTCVSPLSFCIICFYVLENVCNLYKFSRYKSKFFHVSLFPLLHREYFSVIKVHYIVYNVEDVHTASEISSDLVS